MEFVNGNKSIYIDKNLEEKFSFLKHFQDDKKRIEKDFIKAYKYYTKKISTKDFAISLELTLFIYLLIVKLKPKNILDLGSGFSSYVIRKANINSDAIIYTLDDDKDWLMKTKVYLTGHQLDTQNLLHLNNFKDSIKFDFILHDLGRMDTRAKYLKFAFDKLNGPEAIIILDDMHKIEYNNFVQNFLSNKNFEAYDIKNFTLDNFGRYALLLTNFKENV